MSEEPGPTNSEELQIRHWSDASTARSKAAALALSVGFEAAAAEEIALVASELASNLVRHAHQGRLKLWPAERGGRIGVGVEAVDDGPGIPDVERAMTDGHSTAGGLGYGLGTANRLLDEFGITSSEAGTRVSGVRWLRRGTALTPCPLTFGVATRKHPSSSLNGDSFVVKTWERSTLLGVIDGLGHGAFAHRAAQTARTYVERHFDLAMPALFLGTSRACRATRGAVMGVARIDWGLGRFTFAGVGNIAACVLREGELTRLISRRGILGGANSGPAVQERHWEPGSVLVLHSDGVPEGWRPEELPGLLEAPAPELARRLLGALGSAGDDATVLVARERPA